MAEASPYSQGIFQAVKGAMGLRDDYNKITDIKSGGFGGGGADIPLEEYKSKYTEAEAKMFRSQWNSSYAGYSGDIEASQKLAYNYWIGKQKTDTLESLDGYNTVDNLIFEAVETFLPIANRANPDPVVTGGDSPEGIKLSKDTKNMLVDWASKNKLRMQLKKGTRHWILSKLGVWQISYNVIKDEIDLETVNPKQMKFDPDGYWDEYGLFRGDWLSRSKKKSAGTLKEMFPKFETKILELSKGNMTRKLDLEEYWYKGTDIFYFLGEDCLGTFKNPNWNYDGEATRVDPETQQVIKVPIMGKNHKFGPSAPTFPFVGLSVLSTDEHPHDDTSYITQNIPMQDMVNKRFRQIDRNADSQNNGALASGSSFTKEQAAEAATFLRKGGTVWVPNGDVNTAWKRDAAPGLPADIFNQLNDARSELRNIFGTAGSNAQSIAQQDTVRGKIMTQQADSSRIGGGVTEYIEQCADTIYNMVVQFVYVYYDKPHEIPSMGMNGATEISQIRNTDYTVDVTVTVKDGSLIPKDPLTERNEAMDLWTAQAIGLPELYERLDFADPMESAKQTLLWQMVATGKMPPQALFPDFMGPQANANPMGGEAVNPTLETGVPEQPPTSPGAVAQESQQLIQSVPEGPI